MARHTGTVVGGGPAGMMAAERMALAGLAVTLVDRMPTPGRKLLYAGVGGLNLTHSEPLELLLDRYGASRSSVESAIRTFPPTALIAWCEGLGQPTFVGSSGRVFPEALKAGPLLRAWIGRLAALGVEFRMRHEWIGWDAAGAPVFEPALPLPPGPVVLAMGGATWRKLGADGAWAAAFPPEDLAPFRPSNCGFTVPWSAAMQRHAGTPLKRVAVTFEGRRVPGELMITENGVEGGPVYALCPALRDSIEEHGEAVIFIDLRPDIPAAALAWRLSSPRRGQSVANLLRKVAGLPPVAATLLREASPRLDPANLANTVKACPLSLVGTAPFDRAISTAGGLRFGAALPPGVFAAGEMLDWEAPTGGYLLQASFSTGYVAGEAAAAWTGV